MPTSSKKNIKMKKVKMPGRKKVLLISVFAFTVIGAGIIVRSFAATSTATFGPPSITKAGNGNNGQLVTELQQGSKKNTQVFQAGMYGYPAIGSGTTEGYEEQMDPLLRANKGKQARVCMIGRGVEGNVSVKVEVRGYTDNPDYFINYLNFGGTYSTQCTSPFVISARRIDYFGASAGRIGFPRAGGAPSFRLGAITFEIIN